MRLRDPLTYRQPQPEPTTFRHSRSHAISAPESFEDVWEVRRRYSYPCVTHRKGDVVRMSAEPQLHFPTGGRVFDRIGDQVEEQLTQTRAISHHRRVRGERQIYRYPLRLAQDQRGLKHLLHQRL